MHGIIRASKIMVIKDIVLIKLGPPPPKKTQLFLYFKLLSSSPIFILSLFRNHFMMSFDHLPNDYARIIIFGVQRIIRKCRVISLKTRIPLLKQKKETALDL